MQSSGNDTRSAPAPRAFLVQAVTLAALPARSPTTGLTCASAIRIFCVFFCMGRSPTGRKYYILFFMSWLKTIASETWRMDLRLSILYF